MKKADQSRRRFLKTTAAAMAGMSFIPNYGAAPAILSGKQRKLGIALVGLGYYSTDVLAPALQQTQSGWLAGIVTGTPEKEKIWAERYGIPKKNIYNYENFDGIADNQDIDIVYVVLPNSMHKEFTIRAAKAGKHVICEKPMAMNADECREMIRACHENGVELSIGYRLHFEPYTQEVMRMAKTKPFGNIQQITCGAAFRNQSYHHWKFKRNMGGGALMDMGVYVLQGARYATGEEPVKITARGFNTRPEQIEDVEDAVFIDLEFPSGALASLQTGFHSRFNYLDIYAEKGWIKLEPFSGYGGIKGKTSKGIIELPNINQQAAQMDEVAECILSGKKMRVPGEEGLKDMVIVDEIYKQIRS